MKARRNSILLESGKKKLASLLLVSSLLSLEACFGASSIPWKDNFETNTPGQSINGINGWISVPAVIVVNTNAPYPAAGHTNACSTISSINVLSNAFAGVTARKLITDIYYTPQTKKSPGNPTYISSNAVQLYFNSNGYPVIVDGPYTNWVICTTTPGGAPVTPITDCSWTRVTVFQNFSNQTWSLSINDQLVNQNAGFATTSITNYNGFYLKGSTYVDNAWVASSLPSTTNNSGNPELVWDGNVDSMGDLWAVYYLGVATNAFGSLSASGDLDGDGRLNREEFTDKTDPTDPSSRLPGGIWTLPYVENFDVAPLGSVLTWHGLTSSPPNSIVVQSSSYFQGGRAMAAASTGQVDLVITDNTATNVWFDMYVKMNVLMGEDSVSLPTNQASAFFVNKNGYVVAYNGTISNWITLTNSYTNIAYTANPVAPVNGTNWFRVIINQDFQAKQWSIFKADNVTNRIATNIAANLGFCTNTLTSFGGFSMTNSVTNGAPYVACVDNITISTNKPDVIDSNNNGIPDNWEAIYTNSYTGMVATADSDGDGVNNLYEYISGTDPNNASDFMKVIAMDPTNSDIQINFRLGSNRNYRVLASDYFASNKTVAGSAAADWWQTNVVWTHTNAVIYAPAMHRFYVVSAERGGLAYTNIEEWAMYLQPKYSGLWSMCGTPVDFETGNGNNLTNVLGTQLMRGFKATTSANTTNGDQLYVLSGTNAVSNEASYVRHWLTADSSLWYAVGSTQAYTRIVPMQGFWVRRNETFSTNTVITGRTRTNAYYTIGISNAWNFLAWPYATERAESTGPDLGWGFMKCGGIGNNIGTNADNIYVVQSNSWKILHLLPSGRWWDSMRGSDVDFTMKAGQGFYYYHRGSGFTWTNSYGP